jgi:DnaK suppressor protein
MAQKKPPASKEPKKKLPRSYRPSEREPFMNVRQMEYFRQHLVHWREELVRDSTQTLINLQEETLQAPDIADRASAETERSVELRTRDRERKLITKIGQALRRIVEGTYGYCEETGEPIGLRRLEARPIATLSLEAQERHERMEKIYRDD